MKSKKNLLILMVLFALLLTLLGGVLAYMFNQTGHIHNLFNPATVSCRVIEEFDATTGEKKSITVENTGNVPAYVRVRLVTYWVKNVDGKEVIVADKPAPKLNIEVGQSGTNTNWVEGLDNTYYYYRPLQVGPHTNNQHLTKVNLLAKPIVLMEEDGCRQVVEVFAEAIQAEPPKAVETSWGVTLDATGNIKTVPTI